MAFKDITKWNIRMSAVYALGVWTMIGSYAYLKYTGRIEDLSEKYVEEEQKDDSDKVVIETKYNKTVIVYKKDFVPYTTRLYNLIKPFIGESGNGDESK